MSELPVRSYVSARLLKGTNREVVGQPPFVKRPGQRLVKRTNYPSFKIFKAV